MKRLCLLAFFLTMALSARSQLLDGVVAVVGDEVILKSEIDEQLKFYAYQNRIPPDDERLPLMWRQILEEAINLKILFTKAKIDSVNVPSEEIDAQVERRMEFIRQRLGNDEAIGEYFGKSISQLRADMREEIRAGLMVEQLRRKKFGNLTVSNEEVARFYETYKDSLPEIPAEFEAAFIAIRPKVDSLAKKPAYEKILDIQRRLKEGADFAEMAKRYSEDGSAQNGGDLGFAKRGEFVKPFEEAAFSLREGQISKIVETIFGYHLIQLLEKRGESVRVRHILVKFDRSKLNDADAIAQLNAIRERVQTGKTSFGLEARLFSEDEESAQHGGDIISPQTGSNRVAFDEIKGDPELKRLLETMNVGEISEPQRYQISGGEYAYRIVWLKYRAEAHKMNLKQDYARIRNLALQKRQSELYQAWLGELRKQVFWKITL
ncbi:MAG: peptidylprolyl isomerase [Chloroherpetonaceae bacterium]|nr:peptidylprolyl isomerase [Chloroherpetonaceae bacterium]MDW8437394.1 peptidylprolyl isomerase [Chloroherpetonaceae bacterium]